MFWSLEVPNSILKRAALGEFATFEEGRSIQWSFAAIDSGDLLLAYGDFEVSFVD
jgi:hypothetical protein